MNLIKASGLYKGIVVDTNDPSGKFRRIRVRIPKFHGTVTETITNQQRNNKASLTSIRYKDSELPWCEVAFPFSSDTLPEVGQVVVVGFISGDTSQPIVLGWMGYDYTDKEDVLSIN